jgi:gluconate kinase
VSARATKDTRRGLFLVTGAQAAGKSTVGRLLAERFDRGAFIEGDLMWKLVVSGAEDMGGGQPSDEAVRQYLLRLRHGAMLADSLYENGFTAVHSDIVMGESLSPYLQMVRNRPRYVVMLYPSVEAIVARERARPKTAYRDLGPTLADAVETFYGWIDATERIGLWLDSTDQTPEETVDEIMSRVWAEGMVP